MFVLFSVMFVFSCSTEQEDLEVLESTKLIAIQCQGYGIFSNHTYDCGWKRGYEDWVFQYNTIVQSYGLPECNKIQVVTTNGTVRMIFNNTDNSVNLIQATINTYQSYYNNLFNNTAGDWNQGKIAGYLAGRGQMPYSGNNSPICI